MVLPLGDVQRTRIVPYTTYLLIALNVAIYLLQVEQGDRFTVSHAATPYEITHRVDLDHPVRFDTQTADSDPAGADPDNSLIEQGPVGFPIWLTLLTSLFLHGSPLHLAGNMLYLWIFGDNVEEVLGAVRYVAVYLVCGVSGTLLQIAANPNSLLPTLGASGAIAGLMGIYVFWFPRHRMRVLVFQWITEMPAIVVVGFWIVVQVALGLNSLSQTGRSGGVAYLAHVGGAMAGLVFAVLYRRRAIAFQAKDYDDAWFDRAEIDSDESPEKS